MAEFCGQCAHLDFNNKEKYTSKNRYYCNNRRKYVQLTERACFDWLKDPSKCKNNDGGFKLSGCSFSTIIRDVLGYDDNCELLNLLRDFRDNILKKDNQYLPILLEYDQISPLINERIQKDNNKLIFCMEFLQNFLLPFVCSLKQNELENAIAIYKNMFEHLKEKFGFSNMKVDLNIKYNFETIGKGRLRQKANEF